MNGEYEPGEKRQELEVKFIFKVKHNPGDHGHLAVLLNNHLKSKGLELHTDGNELFVTV